MEQELDENHGPTAAEASEAPRGALDRALHLIDLLGSDLPRATLSELAVAAGLSLSTTSRLLGTLAGAGLVQRDPARLYTLGPRLVELGRRAAETHAAASLDQVHPLREDALAVLRRELRDARDALLGELLHDADLSWPAGSSPEQELAAVLRRESTWLECAVQIADRPGGLVDTDDSPDRTPAAMPGAAPDAWTAVIDQARTRTLEWIDTLGTDELSRIGTHRRQGAISVLQCLQEIASGDRAQLLRLQGKPAPAEGRPGKPALPSITHERRVLLHHVNLGGVTTTLSMLIFLEEAEAALLRSLGLSEVERRFIRIYFEIQHRRPCYYDDVLTVHLMVSRVGSTSTHYDFTIFNGGAVAAFGRWGLAYRDETGGAATIPEPVRTVLQRPQALAPGDEVIGDSRNGVPRR